MQKIRKQTDAQSASILLGPAGSPAKSTLEGITEVKKLGLCAMEVQYTHGIKMNLALAEEVGKVAKKRKNFPEHPRALLHQSSFFRPKNFGSKQEKNSRFMSSRAFNESN